MRASSRESLALCGCSELVTSVSDQAGRQCPGRLRAGGPSANDSSTVSCATRPDRRDAVGRNGKRGWPRSPFCCPLSNWELLRASPCVLPACSLPAPCLSNFLEKCCISEKSRKKLVKFGENSAKFWQNLRNFGKKTAKNSAIFNENFEIRERCKGVHCVDLGESFPTSIYLQNLASIQPRTSLFNFD